MRELFGSITDKLLDKYLSTELMLAAEAGVWQAPLWTVMEQAGLGLALAPEDRGGAGASWGDAYAIVRSAGAHGAPVPICETLLANWVLSQARLNVLEGPLTLADVHDLTIHNGRTTGLARGVPWGRSASYLLAVTHGEAPQLLVLAIGHARAELASNIGREPRDDLAFDGADIVLQTSLPPALPADCLRLGGAMLRAAQMAGGLARLVELTSSYANDRIQFGRSISKFQVIQHQIAVLAEQAALANAAADAAFCQADTALSGFAIATAKVSSGEAVSAGAAIAHAVHGAIGFTYEHALHLITRRLWSWRDEFGSEGFWASHLGREVCAAGPAAFWPGIVQGHFSAQAPDKP
jgi:acyl-CoA dehydrogenase